MVTGREDVGEHRKVPDLRHRLLFIGKLDQVEIRVRNLYVFGLVADPPAHIDIPIRSAGTSRIHAETDSRLSFTAVPATPTSNIERDCHQVSYVQELDVTSLLDDLARDLVPQHEAGRSSCAPAHH